MRFRELLDFDRNAQGQPTYPGVTGFHLSQGEWSTFYLMAERSNSLTIWRRLGQVVGSIPDDVYVPFFIFFLFFPKKEI